MLDRLLGDIGQHRIGARTTSAILLEEQRDLAESLLVCPSPICIATGNHSIAAARSS
jgi:hypothetical protein